MAIGVDAPWTHISESIATSAFSERCRRSNTSVEKRPSRSCGTRSYGAPTRVTSERLQHPDRQPTRPPVRSHFADPSASAISDSEPPEAMPAGPSGWVRRFPGRFPDLADSVPAFPFGHGVPPSHEVTDSHWRAVTGKTVHLANFGTIRALPGIGVRDSEPFHAICCRRSRFRRVAVGRSRASGPRDRRLPRVRTSSGCRRPKSTPAGRHGRPRGNEHLH